MTTNWNPTVTDHHAGGAVQPVVATEVSNTFRWRDRFGEHHDVKNMETRHLFFTLRMIWNNTMPAQYRLPGNLYVFGKHYTKHYMVRAVRALAKELAGREDMAPEWQRQLQQMIAWLSTPQLTTELDARLSK